MSNFIHPTALIMEGAVLGQNNHIGPYCVVNANVILGSDNILKSHVVLDGYTKIGDHNQFFPFASIGTAPQDKKYQGEDSKLIIGSHNIFREYTTANPGTQTGGMITKIGDNCLFMVSSHIAHDCFVGNEVILANCVALAGHVHVGDYAIIGGLSAVLQRTRIGAHAMIGGMSGVAEDVIPYGVVLGERAYLSGLNLVGLKRRNFTKDTINEIRNAYKKIFLNEDGTLSQRVDIVKQESRNCKEVMLMLDFLTEDDSRVFCKPKV